MVVLSLCQTEVGTRGRVARHLHDHPVVLSKHTYAMTRFLKDDLVVAKIWFRNYFTTPTCHKIYEELLLSAHENAESMSPSL